MNLLIYGSILLVFLILITYLAYRILEDFTTCLDEWTKGD